MPSDRLPLTRRLLADVVRHRAAFYGMISCMVLVGLLEPLLPWMIAPLLDAGNAEKVYAFGDGWLDEPVVVNPLWLPYFLLGWVLMRGGLAFGRSYLGGWLNASLQRDYRGEMSAQLLRQPMSVFRKDTTGLMTTRIMAFLPTMTGAILPVSMALVQETIRLSGYVLLMFFLEWQLALVILAVAPLAAVTIRLLNRRIKVVSQRGQRETAILQSRLNETIRLADIIKVHGPGSGLARLRETFSRLRGVGLRTSVVLSAGQPLTHVLLAVPMSIVIGYIVHALQTGGMSTGETAAFVSVMVLSPTPVRIITRALNTWEQMLVAAREVYAFLDASAEPDEGGQVLDRCRGEVAFERIGFDYEAGAKPVFEDLSLTIRSGETVALVGRSGAGKTTLVNLLLRFYAPRSGVVRVDGVDIRGLTLDSLRRQFALVTQEPLLFDDTVAMNVAYPDRPDAARLRRALEDAAADFVFDLPDGVESWIGEGGDRLSGGQRQRLALARAFYRDAPIVLLDEATSALDGETEGLVKEGFRRLLSGKTAIIIAHRFSTIDCADRIVVMDNGRILDSGTVAALRERCPLFAELYDSQIPTVAAGGVSGRSDGDRSGPD